MELIMENIENNQPLSESDYNKSTLFFADKSIRLYINNSKDGEVVFNNKSIPPEIVVDSEKFLLLLNKSKSDFFIKNSKEDIVVSLDSMDKGTEPTAQCLSLHLDSGDYTYEVSSGNSLKGKIKSL
tara:strand:- start:53394 stop:53771 length:378 start_codon:yes stop_codon:yes gene_type:complete